MWARWDSVFSVVCMCVYVCVCVYVFETWWGSAAGTVASTWGVEKITPPCADVWTSQEGGEDCKADQYGCPSVACDGSHRGMTEGAEDGLDLLANWYNQE